MPQHEPSLDEQQIHQRTAQWLDATRAGDGEGVLALMTDDVVFLVAGREPMDKAGFAAAARAQAAGRAPRVDGHSQVQEVRVDGAHAYVRSKLRVVATPADGGAATTRAGYTLSVFRREQGRGLLARDSNLLVPVGAD